MEEVRCIGINYSWNNRQSGGQRIYSNLDWVFSTEAWGDAYNDCFTSYHKDVQSDQCFLLLKCICPDARGIRPFRFFNMWCDYPRYMDIVKSVWESQNQFSLLLRLASKLSRLKTVLKSFNRDEFGDVVSNYRESLNQVAVIRVQLQSNLLDSALLLQEKSALAQLSQTTLAYEKFLYQKSKVTWMKFGDDCSSYFHSAIKSRGARNRILSYMDNGVRVDDFGKVVEHFMNHFQSIMGTGSLSGGKLDRKFVSLRNTLSIEHEINLIKPFSSSEIEETLFGIGSNKSPGFDGFGSGFFKHSWD